MDNLNDDPNSKEDPTDAQGLDVDKDALNKAYQSTIGHTDDLPELSPIVYSSDVLFGFYREELEELYKNVIEELKKYQDALTVTGNNAEYVERFKKTLLGWNDIVQKGFTSWAEKVDIFASDINTHINHVNINVAELNRLKTEIDAVNKQYEALLYQLNEHRITIKAQDRGAPLDLIRAHVIQLEQHQEAIQDMKMRIKALETAKKEADARRHQIEKNARDNLLEKITKMQSYFDGIGLDLNHEVNYHGVYGYLRVALENCPPDALDETVQGEIDRLSRTIEARINKDIHHAETRFWLFRKSAHWRNYYYVGPKDQINNLYHTVVEHLKIRAKASLHTEGGQ